MLFEQLMTLPNRPSETAIGIRVTRAERAWFHAIAAAQGVTLSDAVRAAMATQGVALDIPAPEAATAV